MAELFLPAPPPCELPRLARLDQEPTFLIFMSFLDCAAEGVPPMRLRLSPLPLVFMACAACAACAAAAAEPPPPDENMMPTPLEAA